MLKRPMNYRLRALRMALGLTQKAVAEMCSCSPTYISLYERGKINNSGRENDIYQALHLVVNNMKKEGRCIREYYLDYAFYIEMRYYLLHPACIGETTESIEHKVIVETRLRKAAKNEQ